MSSELRQPGAPAKAYRFLLRRTPTAAEVESARGRTIGEVARAVVQSDEYRTRVADGDPRIGYLAGSETAAVRLPPGATSKDGAAIAGTGGQLFLDQGGNAVGEQFRGRAPLPDAAVDGWVAVADARAAAAERLCVPVAMLAVPDKLALYPERYPGGLEAGGPRPVQQLAERLPDALLYPADRLVRARAQGDVAPCTDSHLSLHGAQVVLSAVLERLGLDDHDVAASTPTTQGLVAGGLAGRFGVRVFDVQDVPRGDDTVAGFDNAESILARGSHQGVQRVARNSEPVHPGRLLVFGDSYCWPNHFGLLGVLLERTFSEVHFVWTPFAWDPVLAASYRPDFVLLESAERFMVRVPAVESDVLRTTTRVIGRSTPEWVSRLATTHDRR